MIINKSITDPVELNEYLQQASVEIEYFVVSLGALMFKVSKKENADAFLCFSAATFVNCPNKMKNVNLSIHDKKEKIIERYIPESDAILSPALLLFDINSQEGNFSVLAEGLWFVKGNETNEVRLAINNAYSDTIWKGGITFKELANN